MWERTVSIATKNFGSNHFITVAIYQKPQKKFPYNDLQQMLRHFIQVHRADEDEMPDCVWPIIWEDVKASLIHWYDIFFKELETKKQNEMAERNEQLRSLIESRNKKKQA